MAAKSSPTKTRLHPRNQHAGRYDFAVLVRACPSLGAFVTTNPAGEPTVDFANPAAVRALNQALLRHYYGVSVWDIPQGYLCPAIPGRADYVHHLADLLGTVGKPVSNCGRDALMPRDETCAMPRRAGTSPHPLAAEIAVLDIGVGANCVYPIIGVAEYGWRFVGSETDPIALASAQRIVDGNPRLAAKVELRQQRSASAVFEGVVGKGERFAASMCNPPFHESPAAAAAGTERKLRNLAGGRKTAPVLNFGGQGNELWCRGGEVAFVRRMISESARDPQLCRWFTTLVSKRDSLPPLQRALAAARPAEIRTIEIAHGQKKSRILAWRFEG